MDVAITISKKERSTNLHAALRSSKVHSATSCLRAVSDNPPRTALLSVPLSLVPPSFFSRFPPLFTLPRVFVLHYPQMEVCSAVLLVPLTQIECDGEAEKETENREDINNTLGRILLYICCLPPRLSFPSLFIPFYFPPLPFELHGTMAWNPLHAATSGVCAG